MDEEFFKRLGLSVARGVPQMATGFVDLASLPFTLTGLLEPEEAVGSTAYLTERGLLPPPQEGVVPETMEMVSSAMSPSGAGKELLGGLLGLGTMVGAKNVPKFPQQLKQMSKEDFLGSPKIVSPKDASDLKPRLLTTNENVESAPFMGNKYQIKMSEDGAAVLDNDKVVASYNFGDTLVVDPKYRKKGIAEELVYQYRTAYPEKAKAKTRTKASQAIQEKVWDRIKMDEWREKQY